MANVVMKRKDSWPPLKATLQEENASTKAKEAINLTTAVKVKFIAKSGSHVIEGTCTISSAAKGEVEYTFTSAETENLGTYEVEFQIEWGTGKYQSVPNQGFDTLEIVENIAAAN
jgi:hypothetical protein